jgi:hypothetical protein
MEWQFGHHTAQSLVKSVPDWPAPAMVQFGSADE